MREGARGGAPRPRVSPPRPPAAVCGRSPVRDEVASLPGHTVTAGCLWGRAMELRLDGSNALITGASRGIGQAIALAFCRAGASVMLSSRKAEALADSAAEIEAAKGDRAGEVAWSVANAGDPEQADACVARSEEGLGPVQNRFQT